MYGLKYIDLNTLGHGCVLYNVKSVTHNIRVDADAGSFVCNTRGFPRRRRADGRTDARTETIDDRRRR